MAITNPVIFTDILDAEVKYKRSVTEETVRKMVQDLNLLGELSPIGSVQTFQLNHTGVTPPDPTIYQLMDGSEITYANSPLRTMGLTQRFTPNMVGMYPRGAATTSANLTGGTPFVNLSHAHSTNEVSGSVRGEEGSNVTARIPHYHGIQPDLNSSEPIEMAHQRLAFYLKIT